MQTRTADSKGRITLGDRFANRMVIVEEVDDTEVRVTLARVIPEREAWLHENATAQQAIARGLDQAKLRRFVKAPDLARDAKLAEQIRDDN